MTDRPTISLQEAADRLGVHYMTAYRYVRLGKLPATKVGKSWHVDPADVEALTDPRAPSPVADWPTRLEERLLAGDEAGAWLIVEATLASGGSPAGIYIDGMGPALRSIGRRWEEGSIDVSEEHRASRIVARLVARMSPRFVTPGRRRGTIIMGSPSGDTHYLGGSMLADLLRAEHFHVDELGADTPPASFAKAASDTPDLVAVGISAFKPGNDEVIADTVAALKAVAAAPVFVGGGAVADANHARRLGADGFAVDAGNVVALFLEAAESERT